MAAIIFTVAEPEIAPAAPASIADLTCSGVEIPKPNNAPSITAVVPLPGIPKVNHGTKAPEHAALFAVSGAVSP